MRVRRHRGEKELAICKTNLQTINECYDEVLNTIAMAETIKKEEDHSAEVAVEAATGAKEKSILHSDAFKQFHIQIKGWLTGSDEITNPLLRRDSLLVRRVRALTGSLIPPRGEGSS